ncbi:MAG: LysR family transcriptional regulator [Paracoccaceae bacterium]
MAMRNWDEIHTAYHVAKQGTVSGAAQVMGVHHATVIRHIDALEKKLGVRLFQRHARGYTPTQAGQELLQVAAVAADQFGQMEGRIRGQIETMCGELVITSPPGEPALLAQVISRFQLENPRVVVRQLTDESIARLDYGEAHVAIRAGSAPQQPDNVVQKLGKLQIGLYASEVYVARNGRLELGGDYSEHRFVGHDREDHPAPFMQWLAKAVPREQVMTRSNDFGLMDRAVRSGAGIGFLGSIGKLDKQGLVEMVAPRPDWVVNICAVTHVDIHRTNKVQAFLKILKDAFRDRASSGA